MKRRMTILMFVWTALVLAHDEGHGTKLTDSAKQGGVLAPVIEAKDAKLGPKAAVVYKGELVRSEDGTVRVYLYDAQMSPLKLDGFAKAASAVVETHGKKSKKINFELSLEGDAFVGQAPKPARKPFNIDVRLTEKDKSLLVAFDNLD